MSEDKRPCIELVEQAVHEFKSGYVNNCLEFKRLQEDFDHNLSLLEEREAEIGHYEQLLLESRRMISEKTGIESFLKVEIDKLREQLHRQEIVLLETRAESANNIIENNKLVEELKSTLREERGNYSKNVQEMKLKSTNDLTKMREKHQSEKMAIISQFDGKLRDKTYELRVKVESLEKLNSEYSFGEALLKNETDALRADLRSKDQRITLLEEDVEYKTKKLGQKDADIETLKEHYEEKCFYLNRIIKNKEIEESASKIREEQKTCAGRGGHRGESEVGTQTGAQIVDSSVQTGEDGRITLLAATNDSLKTAIGAMRRQIEELSKCPPQVAQSERINEMMNLQKAYFSNKIGQQQEKISRLEEELRKNKKSKCDSAVKKLFGGIDKMTKELTSGGNSDSSQAVKYLGGKLKEAVFVIHNLNQDKQKCLETVFSRVHSSKSSEQDEPKSKEPSIVTSNSIEDLFEAVENLSMVSEQ